MLGDETAIAKALDHVVAYASRHARSMAKLTVTRSESGSAVVHVDDDGHGIPPDQREAVVQRFGA